MAFHGTRVTGMMPTVKRGLMGPVMLNQDLKVGRCYKHHVRATPKPSQLLVSLPSFSDSFIDSSDHVAQSALWNIRSPMQNSLRETQLARTSAQHPFILLLRLSLLFLLRMQTASLEMQQPSCDYEDESKHQTWRWHGRHWFLMISNTTV